jgi:hypothetical protein
MQKKINFLETNTNVLISDSLKDEISFNEKINSISNRGFPEFIFQINDSLLSIKIKKYSINRIKLEYNSTLLKYLLDKISASEKFETNIAYIIKIDDIEILKEERLIDLSFTKKTIILQFLNTY